jgi:hypothetical protein
MHLGLARAVSLGSKSHRTHDHILLSHLRFPSTWRARSPYLYLSGTEWSSYTTGTGFPFRYLLQLAGLWWLYSNPPQHGWREVFKFQVISLPTVSLPFLLGIGPQSVAMIRFLLLPDICGLHVAGYLPWREDRSVIYLYRSLSFSGPSPEELMTTSCCLIWLDHWVPFT